MSTPPSAQRIAQLCKAAGDPLRLEILRVLRHDSFGVLELSEIFDIRQSGMSHHLKVLASAGLLTTRREGNSIFYRRALVDPWTAEGALVRNLYAAADALPTGAEGVAEAISRVKYERAEVAREFFNRVAGAQEVPGVDPQELIAAPEHYLDSAHAMLQQCLRGGEALAVEIGPGDGRFLATLSGYFGEVLALDISEEMLARAEAFCRERQAANVRFMRGNTQDARREGIVADGIVCNMVLHHVPSPADVFMDCAHLLRSGGSLVVTDLCRHEQQWARDRCGDLWLGFEPREMTDWAVDAGLVEAESMYLGLRNGFQVQVRRFDKRA